MLHCCGRKRGISSGSVCREEAGYLSGALKMNESTVVLPISCLVDFESVLSAGFGLSVQTLR